MQITPHPSSVFSCRSSEVSTNTNLINEAVSNLGKAAFVNLICICNYESAIQALSQMPHNLLDKNYFFCLNAFKPYLVCNKSVGPLMNRLF